MAQDRGIEHRASGVYDFTRAFLHYARGVAVMINVYMDESGIHAGSPVVTSSAVWARPSVWRSWTREWERAKQPIKIYHASECHNFRGEFEGWTRAERDALVKRLLPTFPGHKLHGRFTGIHVEALNRCLADDPEIRHRFQEPYFACLHWAFWHVCAHVAKHRLGRISFIHEETNLRPDVLEAYAYTRRQFPNLEMTLGFGAKALIVPLQAADMVAYGGYKLLEGGAGASKALDTLDPTGKRMRKAVYGQEDAAGLASKLRTMLAPAVS